MSTVTFAEAPALVGAGPDFGAGEIKKGAALAAGVATAALALTTGGLGGAAYDHLAYGRGNVPAIQTKMDPSRAAKYATLTPPAAYSGNVNDPVYDTTAVVESHYDSVPMPFTADAFQPVYEDAVAASQTAVPYQFKKVPAVKASDIVASKITSRNGIFDPYNVLSDAAKRELMETAYKSNLKVSFIVGEFSVTSKAEESLLYPLDDRIVVQLASNKVKYAFGKEITRKEQFRMYDFNFMGYTYMTPLEALPGDIPLYAGIFAVLYLAFAFTPLNDVGSAALEDAKDLAQSLGWKRPTSADAAQRAFDSYVAYRTRGAY